MDMLGVVLDVLVGVGGVVLDLLVGVDTLGVVLNPLVGVDTLGVVLDPLVGVDTSGVVLDALVVTVLGVVVGVVLGVSVGMDIEDTALATLGVLEVLEMGVNPMFFDGEAWRTVLAEGLT